MDDQWGSDRKRREDDFGCAFRGLLYLVTVDVKFTLVTKLLRNYLDLPKSLLVHTSVGVFLSTIEVGICLLSPYALKMKKFTQVRVTEYNGSMVTTFVNNNWGNGPLFGPHVSTIDWTGPSVSMERTKSDTYYERLVILFYLRYLLQSCLRIGKSSFQMEYKSIFL